MLVLSRKKNEKIIIDQNITITVVEIRGDKVRLGVESPPEVTVHRQEAFDDMRAQSDLWKNKLLPKLMAQYECGLKAGLTLKNPAELKDTFINSFFLSPIQATDAEVLYVNPDIPPNELAQAYSIPAPPPALNQTLVKRPERPYLLFVHLEPGKIVEPLAALEQWHKERTLYIRENALLLPTEAILLAAERPAFLGQHGITAVGMALSLQAFTPEKEVNTPVLSMELVKEAYWASLVPQKAGSFRWILHQGTLENCTVPTVMSVV